MRLWVKVALQSSVPNGHAHESSSIPELGDSGKERDLSPSILLCSYTVHAYQGGRSSGQVLGCALPITRWLQAALHTVAIISRDSGPRANRVVKEHLVFLEDILQETNKCLERDTQELSAT